MAKRPRLVVAVLLAVLTLHATSVAGAEKTADYVIHISCDGLRGDLLAGELAAGGPGKLPAFHRLVSAGACTFNARADFTNTTTLPNHICMLTGLPVARPRGGSPTSYHGWTKNGTPAAGETLHGTGNPDLAYVHSIFDVVHDAGLSTALYAGKGKFVLFDRSWDADHGAPDELPPDDGRDKIDRYVVLPLDEDRASDSLNAVLLADMRGRPARFTFVHYADLDAVGHDFGWGGPEYRSALARIDRMLGELLRVIDAEPRLAGRTAIILTSDHGGVGRNHSDPQRIEDCTIPFLAWGAGVARGRDLYALNPGIRRDPAHGRPPTAAVPPPVRNGDAANLELHLLGLGPVPGSTIGVRQELQVEPATEPARPTTGSHAPGGH